MIGMNFADYMKDKAQGKELRDIMGDDEDISVQAHKKNPERRPNYSGELDEADDRIGIDRKTALKMFWDAGFDSEDSLTKANAVISSLTPVADGYYYADEVSKKIDSMTKSGELDEANSLRTVEVVFTNGDKLTTNMGAKVTDDDIRKYYRVGSKLNIGNGPKDKMVTISKVNILESESGK